MPPKFTIRPYQINLINAGVLLGIGSWGYFHPEAQRPYALIPVAFGLLFLGTTPLFRSGNRIVGLLVAVLTFLLLLALAQPLIQAFSLHDTWHFLRLSLMALSSTAAAGIYLKTYLQERGK